LRSSPLLAIFLIVAVDVLGMTIMIPLLPFYAERLGATPDDVGLLIATFAACQLVSGPLLGRLSDRTGRRPLLLLSQVGTLIGFLILAGANSLWMVFISRVIDGATAGNLSLAQAYISDVTEPSNRAKSFGIIGIAFGLGFLIGPGISGFLSRFGYHYPVLAAAALSAASIIATYFLLPEAKPAGQGNGPASRRLGVFEWGQYVEYFRRPHLAVLLCQFFAWVLSFGMFTSGFPLFAERRFTWQGAPFGPQQVGYLYAYAGFLGIFLQGPLLGRMVKKFGERALLTVGFLFAAAGYTGLGFTHTLGPLLFVTTIAALGNLVRPTVTSLITQLAGREEQGVVLGLTQSLASVAQIIGPLIAGLLIEHGWLASWALLTAIVTVAGFVLSVRKPAEGIRKL
jgi:MFS family permease